MKCKFTNYVLVGLLFIFIIPVNDANAGLINDTNNNSFIDQNTGLEWMDFGVNNGMSYNDVTLQLLAGGDYYGWKLANKSQVYEMWANAFLGLGASSEFPDGNGLGQLFVYDGADEIDSVFTHIFNVMGFNTNIDLASVYDRRYSSAWFPGTEGLSYVEWRQQSDTSGISQFGDMAALRDYQDYSSSSDEEDIKRGTMLIRVTDVPEPSTLAIFLLGIVGVASRRFKK
ncbi:MAG: hypothetical protein ACI9EK_001782 [Psychroserpens sp.]|jgi:hypothetical protein